MPKFSVKSITDKKFTRTASTEAMIRKLSRKSEKYHLKTYDDDDDDNVFFTFMIFPIFFKPSFTYEQLDRHSIMGGRVGVRLVQFSRNNIRLYLAFSINLHMTLTELFQMCLIREAPF